MGTTNSILNAVVSRLLAERDEVLVQLDLIVNKNQGTSALGVVDDATEAIKKLAQLEQSIVTVQGILSEQVPKPVPTNNKKRNKNGSSS